MKPNEFGLVQDEVTGVSVGHIDLGFPTNVAAAENRAPGLAVNFKNPLFAKSILEISDILSRIVVHHARWTAGIGDVVVGRPKYQIQLC